MEKILYLVLIGIASAVLITAFLQRDWLSRTITFGIAIILWLAAAVQAFNIELIEYSGGWQTYQIFEPTYVFVGALFAILALLNAFESVMSRKRGQVDG